MGDDAIVLIQFEISPFADKIRRILHYKGLAHSVRELPPSKLSQVRKLSPAGKLPVLEHGGRRIADSTDIALYLDSAFPERPVLPTDPADRGLALVYEDWADESLYFYDLTMRAWPHNIGRLFDDVLRYEKPLWAALFRRLFPGTLAKTTKAQGLGRKSPAWVVADARRLFESLEAILGSRNWLVGEELSLADISVRSMLLVIARAEEGAEILDTLKALQAWQRRVDAETLPPPA